MSSGSYCLGGSVPNYDSKDKKLEKCPGAIVCPKGTTPELGEGRLVTGCNDINECKPEQDDICDKVNTGRLCKNIFKTQSDEDYHDDGYVLLRSNYTCLMNAFFSS
jgi:hypothetical protein